MRRSSRFFTIKGKTLYNVKNFSVIILVISINLQTSFSKTLFSDPQEKKCENLESNEFFSNDLKNYYLGEENGCLDNETMILLDSGEEMSAEEL